MKARKVIARSQTQWAVPLGKKQGFAKRVRIFGSTKEEAESRASDKLSERRIHGSGLADISATHRAMMVEWRDRLTPGQMVEAFTAYQASRCFTRRVRECVADYISAKTKKDARGKSVWSAEHRVPASIRLNRFAGEFGDKIMGDLIPGDLETFVRAQNGSAGTYHRTLNAMFGHARRHRWIARNPFEEMGKAPSDECAPKDLMKPAQFARLLRIAAGMEDGHRRREPLLAAFVLGGLAGLRTAELRRLTWGKIDLEAGRIHLDGNTTCNVSSRASDCRLGRVFLRAAGDMRAELANGLARGGEVRFLCLTMKTASVADLRNRFPSVFRWIEDGETVELTKRGRVVARIVPAPPAKARKFKMPDFEAMRREIYGDDLESRMLTPEDSAFVHDRGDR